MTIEVKALIVTDELLHNRPTLKGMRYADVVIPDPYVVRRALDEATDLAARTALTEYLFYCIPHCLAHSYKDEYCNQLKQCLAAINVELRDNVLCSKGGRGESMQTEFTDTQLTNLRKYRHLENDARRTTGRTTTIALGYLHKLLSMDEGLGGTLKVFDHYDSAEAHRGLITEIMRIVDKLGLSGFTACKQDRTITYRNPLI